MSRLSLPVWALVAMATFGCSGDGGGDADADADADVAVDADGADAADGSDGSPDTDVPDVPAADCVTLGLPVRPFVDAESDHALYAVASDITVATTEGEWEDA